jgi:K+/H+ antiporter YhaU regulatory subunit KhtT
MASLISLIVIFTLSILITRIASEALIHTGLSKEAAKFQARSAFTGVGFTTNEAESIVNHPVRRKIVMSLMLIGNVGIISAVASLILTFVNQGGNGLPNYLRILIIIGSMGILWLLSKSKYLEKILGGIIKKALHQFTNLNIKDYVELLNLTDEYEITVLKVNPDDWMANRQVKDIKLRQEGINLIGIKREDGNYLGTPYGETRIGPSDRLILYGREKSLKNLEQRKQNMQGDQEHKKAIREQQVEKVKQEKQDKEASKQNQSSPA